MSIEVHQMFAYSCGMTVHAPSTVQRSGRTTIAWHDVVNLARDDGDLNRTRHPLPSERLGQPQQAEEATLLGVVNRAPFAIARRQRREMDDVPRMLSERAGAPRSSRRSRAARDMFSDSRVLATAPKPCACETRMISCPAIRSCRTS